MSPLAPAVLVFEKVPRWEAELKRRLSGPELLVRPCRSAADVVALCRQMPGCAVVNDFASDAADGLKLLESLFRRRLRAAVVVVASRALSDLEWPARELGAAHFVSETISPAALARICRQILHADALSGGVAGAVKWASRFPGR